MASTIDFDALQANVVSQLQKRIFKAAPLPKYCPLDINKHVLDTSSDPDLGGLSCLLLELQQQVALHLDIEGFISFRRVN